MRAARQCKRKQTAMPAFSGRLARNLRNGPCLFSRQWAVPFLRLGRSDATFHAAMGRAFSQPAPRLFLSLLCALTLLSARLHCQGPPPRKTTTCISIYLICCMPWGMPVPCSVQPTPHNSNVQRQRKNECEQLAAWMQCLTPSYTAEANSRCALENRICLRKCYTLQAEETYGARPYLQCSAQSRFISDSSL